MRFKTPSKFPIKLEENKKDNGDWVIKEIMNAFQEVVARDEILMQLILILLLLVALVLMLLVKMMKMSEGKILIIFLCLCESESS